jgi:predicted SAM-dependent methyltransferase
MNIETLNIPDNFKLLALGSGNFDHHDDGWVNLDYTFETTKSKRNWDNIDIKHNLMWARPLPLPDNRFRGVYTEHALEHLTESAVGYTVKEVFRILQPGGTFRIAVPDAQRFWDIVTGIDRVAEEFPSVWRPKYQINTKEQVFLDALLTPLRGTITDQEVQKIISTNSMHNALAILQRRMGEITEQYQSDHPGAHISWWDYDKLSFLLDTYGFVDISKPLARNESRYKAFRKGYIDRTAFKCTIRIEASKPCPNE